MGLGPNWTVDRYDEGRSIGGVSIDKYPQTVYIDRTPNPQPHRYKILKALRVRNYLIVKIKYLDCTNYEGVKILVYQGIRLADLKKQKLIDPHFSENKKYNSPIARFEPTEKGWRLALKLCKS
jgi:hypothetical protein